MKRYPLRLLGLLVAACLFCVSWPALAEEAPVEEIEAVELGDMPADEPMVEESDALEVDMAAATATFADESFQAYVLEHFDTDHNGAISSKEASKVKTIDVSGLGIESLDGIGFFTKLTKLYCADNALTELNLNACKSLGTLYCEGNPLEVLEIGKCTKLVKYVKTAPVLEGDTLIFRKKSGKNVPTMMSMPATAAITLNGKSYFDPSAGFALTTDAATLGVKQKLDLLAEDCGYPAAFCDFELSQKSIVKVSGGVATASKVGDVLVTVTTFDGQVGYTDLMVLKAPTKVTLSNKKLTLGEGQDYELDAWVPDYSIEGDLSWKSNKPSVATVEDGVVTAVGPGKATITVTTYNKKKATCSVTVYAAPTSITLNAHELGLLEDQTYTLKITLNKGAGGEVTLVSDDEDICEVDDATGKLTAKAMGTTVIRATTYNGLTDTCEVTVMPGPETIEFAESSLMLYVGDQENVNATALSADGEDVSQVLTYKSSNEKVATVTADGEVKGKKAGTATITASAANGKKATCKVTVGKAPTSISLDKTTLKLTYDEEEFEGQEYQLKAKMNNGAVGEITFDSSDWDVATVDEDGLVTAMGIGTATITAETFNGKKARCLVTVTAGGASHGPQSRAAELDAADMTDQIVLVEYTGGSSATLSVHENRNGQWVQLLQTPAYVGKKGIGKTREGDKKTPTGTFNLTTPFGIKPDPGANMEYLQVTRDHYWCGTSSSEYYNQLVDASETGRQWTSSDEHLIDYAGSYNYCMFIDYNAEGTPGKGSCIFLHCMGSNSYTAGCVAVSESVMKQIIQWAEPGAMIVIMKA